MWAKEGGDPVDWKLWEPQKKTVRKFARNRKTVILKARQYGLSWIAVAEALWMCMFKDNFHVYITSIGIKEVQEQFTRIKFIYDNLPEWMQKRATMGGRSGGRTRRDNYDIIEFSNGSAIHAISGRKSAGHGAAPGLYIMDEMSRKENDYETWRAIKPSIGPKTIVRIISTSNGRNNLYYDIWKGAETKKNSFTPVFLKASEHPLYTKEFLAQAKKDFAHDVTGYYQAYPETPREAFMSSDRSVFNNDIIDHMLEYVHAKNIIPKRQGYFNMDGSITEDENGFLKIFEEPIPGHRYTIGVDVAEGLTKSDYSVAQVLDATTNRLVAQLRAKIAPEDYVLPISQLGRYYRNAWLVVESNASADYILETLKGDYNMLYCRQVRDNIYDKPTLKPGFRTTVATKPRIITHLREAIAKQENPLFIPDQQTLIEMSEYEEDSRGRLNAPKREGSYDDCVMALALALEGTITMPSARAGSMFTGLPQQRSNQSNLSWRSL